MPAVISLLEDDKFELRVRIKRTIDGKPKLVVNQRRYIQELKVSMADWKYFNNLKTPNARENFLVKNPDFKDAAIKIEAIRTKINEYGESLDSDSMNEIVHSVIYAKEIEAAERKAEAKARKKAERAEARRKAEAMTLTRFIKGYVEAVDCGEKTTVQNGRKYAEGSRRNTANALGHFLEFMEDTGVTYDFQDVDLDCYNRYKAWLMNRDISEGFRRGRLTGCEPDEKHELLELREGDDPEKVRIVSVKGGTRVRIGVEDDEKREVLHYSDGTIGRFMKQLKAVLRAAETRGYPVNPAYRSTEFKAQVLNIDAIYLTQEELERIEAVDVSLYHPESEKDNQIGLARDVFMIGVWTAQRVSDYNNIGKHNIRCIDVNGREQPIVSIHQQKTGRYVEIPCNSKLQAILERYPEGIPHISEQWLNKYIKILGKMAGLNDMVEIKESRGGEIVTAYYPKYQLICSHTARRTGATLMYLSGMSIFDIMKVTGHRNVATLEQYIRADKLDVARNLAMKYSYFK